MPPTTHTTDRSDETDPKFYAPAASPPAFVARRVERALSRLFAHGVETSA